MINNDYSWKWAANTSKEEFSNHFFENRDHLMNQLSLECSNDNTQSLKPLVENILTKIASLPIINPEHSKAIRQFFKKITRWEGDYHWHIDSLLKIYLQANFENQKKLASTTSMLMHSDLTKLANEKLSSMKYPIQTEDEKLLMILCAQGNTEEIQKLIDKGTKLNTCDFLGFTPLHIACIEGHIEVVKALLTNGKLNIDQGDLQGSTPLMYAISWNHEEICSLLIEHYASVVAEDLKGIIPLMLACERNNLKIFNLLLSSGALKTIKKNQLDICFEWIFDNKNLSFFKTLYCLHPFNPHEFLPNAAIKDLSDFVAFLKEKGADIDFRVEGKPMLLGYCELGDLECVTALLKYGADISARNEITGETPLIGSVRAGHKNIVELLLQKQAPLNVVDFNGLTALSWAVNYGYHDIADLLIEAGANPAIQTNSEKKSIDFLESNESPISNRLFNMNLSDKMMSIPYKK